jgi:hypothetical protein
LINITVQSHILPPYDSDARICVHDNFGDFAWNAEGAACSAAWLEKRGQRGLLLAKAALIPQ